MQLAFWQKLPQKKYYFQHSRCSSSHKSLRGVTQSSHPTFCYNLLLIALNCCQNCLIYIFIFCILLYLCIATYCIGAGTKFQSNLRLIAPNCGFTFPSCQRKHSPHLAQIHSTTMWSQLCRLKVDIAQKSKVPMQSSLCTPRIDILCLQS